MEKGVARKLNLEVTIEDHLTHEALLDTAVDISLISSSLFRSLQAQARRTPRELKSHPCVLEIRPYSEDRTIINEVALMQLAIGPMKLVHPVYVAPRDNVPLLIGKDLLNRFKPLIDFKQLRIWAQVQKPLPISLSETVLPVRTQPSHRALNLTL